MLVNWDWLAHQLFSQLISKMSTPLKVKGIGISEYKTNEYFTAFLYFTRTQ